MIYCFALEKQFYFSTYSMLESIPDSAFILLSKYFPKREDRKMERFFENQHKHSREFYKEFCSYSVLKAPPLIFVKFLLIILNGVLILSIIASLIVSEPLLTEFHVLGFAIDIILWLAIYIVFFRTIKLSCNRELETNNGDFLK